MKKSWLVVVLVLQCAQLNSLCLAGPIRENFEKRTNIHRGSTYDWKVEDIQGIGLERTTCFGPCPAYSVIITKDGTFQYDGGENAKRPGRYTGKVNIEALRGLEVYLREIDFFSFADDYSEPAADTSTDYLAIVASHESKTIRLSGGGSVGPKRLWVVGELIDGLLRDATWNGEAKICQAPQGNPSASIGNNKSRDADTNTKK